MICYNITLAKSSKREARTAQQGFLSGLSISRWCYQQLNAHRLPEEQNFIELMEMSLTVAFEEGIIKPEQCVFDR